jgi:hypothetical protein
MMASSVSQDDIVGRDLRPWGGGLKDGVEEAGEAGVKVVAARG